MIERRASVPWFDISIGVIVGLFGIARAIFVGSADPALAVVIAVGMAAAAGLYRRAPLVALGLVWLSAIIQVLGGLDIAVVQLAAVLVAYGTSRYGKTVTVILSVVSIPLGGIVAVTYAAWVGQGVVQESGLWQLLNFVTSATDLGFSDAPTGLVVGFIVVAALLGAPWALGLLVRLRVQNRAASEEKSRAEAETERAQQLAELRTRQARLARDVHDVVGHSLAVIIAQADSTQAMGDDDMDRIRGALANIGETARRSLGDVRSVLSDDDSPTGRRDTSDLEALVEGVRSGGTDVDLTVRGVSRPLPPELEVVAYRALQELLTNALKHGIPGGRLMVDLEWGEPALVITVSNRPAEFPGPGSRTGLAGLRERLQSVGGTFASTPDDALYTAVARVPVRREGGTE